MFALAISRAIMLQPVHSSSWKRTCKASPAFCLYTWVHCFNHRPHLLSILLITFPSCRISNPVVSSTQITFYSSSSLIIFFFKFSLKDIFSLIRERWGRGERQRGPDINKLPPLCAPSSDQIRNLGMGPDLKLNLQPFGVFRETQANWARASLIILTPPKIFLNTLTWNKFQLHYASKE